MIRVFHNALLTNLLNLMTKYLQSKGFDPRISSVVGLCATTEPSAIAIIFKVYASLHLQSSLNSVDSLKVPVNAGGYAVYHTRYTTFCGRLAIFCFVYKLNLFPSGHLTHGTHLPYQWDVHSIKTAYPLKK